MVHGRQHDESEGHTEKVEEERRGVLKCILDQDEGRSPDKDGGEEQKMGDGGRFETCHEV